MIADAFIKSVNKAKQAYIVAIVAGVIMVILTTIGAYYRMPPALGIFFILGVVLIGMYSVNLHRLQTKEKNGNLEILKSIEGVRNAENKRGKCFSNWKDFMSSSDTYYYTQYLPTY